MGVLIILTWGNTPVDVSRAKRTAYVETFQTNQWQGEISNGSCKPFEHMMWNDGLPTVSKPRLGAGARSRARVGAGVGARDGPALFLRSPLQGGGHPLRKTSSSNGNSAGGKLWRRPSVVGIFAPLMMNSITCLICMFCCHATPRTRINRLIGSWAGVNYGVNRT